MNTYRVYALNTASALEPVVHIAHIRAEKYGPAWEGARAALNGAKDAPTLFVDPECKVPAKLGHGDHIVCAKVVDLRPRNVKLDKTALQAVLADPASTPEQKLAAVTALVG